MTQRSIGDFACIIAIEKAQYLAPEEGAEVKDRPPKAQRRPTSWRR